MFRVFDKAPSNVAGGQTFLTNVFDAVEYDDDELWSTDSSKAKLFDDVSKADSAIRDCDEGECLRARLTIHLVEPREVARRAVAGIEVAMVENSRDVLERVHAELSQFMCDGFVDLGGVDVEETGR